MRTEPLYVAYLKSWTGKFQLVMSVIYADPAHCYLNAPEDEEPPYYPILVGEQVTLDVSKYEWLVSQVLCERNRGSVIVHVIRSGGYYKCLWPVDALSLDLEPEGLIPMVGYPRFSGFESGRVGLAVGIEEDTDEECRFTPLWLGVANADA